MTSWHPLLPPPPIYLSVMLFEYFDTATSHIPPLPVFCCFFITCSEALQGFLGEQVNKDINFRGTRAKFFRETGKQRQYWGTGLKQIFDFWETGEQANLFHGNKETGTPLGGPLLCSLDILTLQFFKYDHPLYFLLCPFKYFGTAIL